jgi:hypothetical protein
MNPFVFRNPTKLIFGKGSLDKLREELPSFGKRILLSTEEAASSVTASMMQ